MDSEKLIKCGVDYDEGVNRFAGHKELFEKYLLRILNSDQMEVLRTQLLDKDYLNAFRTAHDLKGTSGNLSMKSFYNDICNLVDDLRDKEPKTDAMKLYNKAYESYKAIENVIRDDDKNASR